MLKLELLIWPAQEVSYYKKEKQKLIFALVMTTWCVYMHHNIPLTRGLLTLILLYPYIEHMGIAHKFRNNMLYFSGKYILA